MTKCPQHSGPIETQDLGSVMEEDHIPQKHPIHNSSIPLYQTF